MWPRRISVHRQLSICVVSPNMLGLERYSPRHEGETHIMVDVSQSESGGGCPPRAPSLICHTYWHFQCRWQICLRESAADLDTRTFLVLCFLSLQHGSATPLSFPEFCLPNAGSASAQVSHSKSEFRGSSTFLHRGDFVPDVHNSSAPDNMSCDTGSDLRPLLRRPWMGLAWEDNFLPADSFYLEAQSSSPSRACFCPSLPPFLANWIYLFSFPVISVPSHFLRHFVASIPSLLTLLTHLCIPLSYFEPWPDLLPAGPKGTDRPAMAVKKKKGGFAVKMDHSFSIMLCFFSQQLSELKIYWACSNMGLMGCTWEC